MQGKKLSFASDYMEGAHPLILERLFATNLEKTPGYGEDAYCRAAGEKIRAACACPQGEVYFLMGGTQANRTVLRALLAPYEGVIGVDTAHIALHEAGAIEAGGHKVLTLPGADGKLSATALESYLHAFFADDVHAHMVYPGVVYLSLPTELGTLYSKKELEGIRAVSHRYGLRLYVDGARLAYALACPENDVSLKDLALLCDAFYIGGTKCGALFGEAVVFPRPGALPHFFTIAKQHGAVLAKGRLLGLQFDTLFTDGLYGRIGAPAIRASDRLRQALRKKECSLLYGSPTNQTFVRMDNRALVSFKEKVEYTFWGSDGEGHTVIRLAMGWSVTEEDVDALIALF